MIQSKKDAKTLRIIAKYIKDHSSSKAPFVMTLRRIANDFEENNYKGIAMIKCKVCNTKMTNIGQQIDTTRGTKSITQVMWCSNDGVLTMCKTTGARITNFPKTIQTFSCPNCNGTQVDAQEDFEMTSEGEDFTLTLYECFDCHQIFYI